MSEDSTPRPQASPDNHAVAAQNPEQHLRDSHKLSIRLQGKEGANGHGVWALVREEQGKVKTLTVHEGTRREAVARFYRYIHPDKGIAPAAPVRRSSGPSRSGPPRSGPPRTGTRPPQRSPR